MNNDNTKVCSKCKMEKPLSGFHRDKNRKDGFYPQCKDCRSAYNKINKQTISERNRLRYQSNRDVYIARSAAWRKANPERVAENVKKWQSANPEKVLSYKKKWRENNPDKTSAQAKKWRENNPERNAERTRRRRAKMKGNGVFKISKKFLRKLYSSPCITCGSAENITQDHIIPIDRGGNHSEGNLQPMCIDCNQSKSTLLMIEFKIKNKSL